MNTFSELAETLTHCSIDGKDAEVSSVAEPGEGSKHEAELWFDGPVESESPVIADDSISDIQAPSVLRVDDLSTQLPAVLEFFQSSKDTWGIHSSATVADDFQCGDPVYVGPNTSIGSNVVLGDDVRIGPNVTILGTVQIADGVEIQSGVRIESPASIGENTRIHANSVIGSDGYGYEQIDGEHRKVPQIGGVEIGADVEIGAAVTVDRGTYGNTVIGDGCKFDNQVHIAHNTKVGDYCLLVAMSGTAGSAELGDHVILAGKAGVKDHVRLADGVTVAARAGVTKDIDEAGAIVSGFPARDHSKQLKIEAHLQKLPRFRKQLKSLKESVENLQERVNSE